jgi:hypothetical protein
MTQQPPPIWIDTALSLPVLVAVGWFWGDVPLATGVAVSGIAVVFNMVILGWLGNHYISSIVYNGNGGLAALGITLKLWLSIMVFWWMLTWYGPIAVALSWISVVLGVAARGILLYVRLSKGLDLEGPA